MLSSSFKISSILSIYLIQLLNPQEPQSHRCQDNKQLYFFDPANHKIGTSRQVGQSPIKSITRTGRRRNGEPASRVRVESQEHAAGEVRHRDLHRLRADRIYAVITKERGVEGGGWRKKYKGWSGSNIGKP